MSEMDEDSGWVFDSLICFLNGPVWNAPLQSFIEEKSLIFEPNMSESPEYQKIFDEFKNLVDFMLGNFMEDIGITPTQFEDACHKGGSQGVPVSFDQNLFELIWAANDYGMFKRMMTQRNVELQLQALELIEQKYGITPQSFIPKGKEEQHSKLQEVSSHASQVKLEEEIMEEIVQVFPGNEKLETADGEDAKYLLEEKNVLKETLKHIEESKPAIKNVECKKIDVIEEKNELEPSTSNVPDLNANKERENKNTKITEEELTFDKRPKAEVDSLELKKRQEYLKAQRDKLVALKKEARKKHLEEDIVKDPKENLRKRPKSAKAAGDLLSGQNPINAQNIQLQQDKLQFRRALVEKLKNEVMTNKEEQYP